jgi:hypothetical protein
MKPLIIHLKAKNDANGNPRRIYAIYNTETGQLIDAIDEGYNGSSAWRKKYPNGLDGGEIDTTPSEIKYFLSLFK